MAKLNKKIYEKKREWAVKRMEENKDIKTLTEEQHDAIANLCTARHEFHTNMSKIVYSDQLQIKKRLINVNIELIDSGLDGVPTIPVDTTDYIDIDSFDDLYEIEQVPEDDTEKDKWRDRNYNRIYNELNELHKKIENYLHEIDLKYETNYAPTGITRLF